MARMNGLAISFLAASIACSGRLYSRLNLLPGRFCQQQVHCLQIRRGSMNLRLRMIYPMFWLLHLQAFVYLRFVGSDFFRR